MAKYSTGGSSGGASDSCELCGAEDRDLRTATVAGAKLDVCGECARHAEDDDDRGQDDDEQERRREAARNTAKLNDARKGNPEHWEQGGTDYDDDPLPYLVKNYGDRLEEARQEAGLQTAELAGELGVDEADVLAVEQGRATRAGVGGALITALEERLNVQLAEDT
ncbi:helix-turn-helix domain-containing protein [Haloglomus halophilum]|uniref:helix-turn-helix domain-containing protein n=1 Tax=Haloglomus halophilum TaxID=2962672 RepID=UPI0020C982F8|nr:multiprotein-bridging factor 1 family protein [Haloglomus halophilum]